MMIILYLHLMGFVSSFSILILKTAALFLLYLQSGLYHNVYPLQNNTSLIIHKIPISQSKSGHLLLHCSVTYALWSFVFHFFGFYWVLPKMFPHLLFWWRNWVGKIFFRFFGIWFHYVDCGSKIIVVFLRIRKFQESNWLSHLLDCCLISLKRGALPIVTPFLSFYNHYLSVHNPCNSVDFFVFIARGSSA